MGFGDAAAVVIPTDAAGERFGGFVERLDRVGVGFLDGEAGGVDQAANVVGRSAPLNLAVMRSAAA
jgi:hypothetical protein